MNRRPLLLGAVALGLTAALAGCGGQKTAPATSASMSAAPSSPSGGAPMSPAPVPSGDKVTEEPITRSVTLGSDGRTLTVVATVAGCQRGELLTRESSTTVTLTLRLITHRPAGQVCPDFIKMAPVKATLTAPLGNRTVVDGTSGEHVAVTRQ